KASRARATASSVSSTPASSSRAIVSSVAGLITVRAMASFEHVEEGGAGCGWSRAEDRQDVGQGEEVRREVRVGVRAVAAPAAVLRFLADPGAHGVQEDVTDRLEQVLVVFDRLPRVVAAEKVAAAAVLAVHAVR